MGTHANVETEEGTQRTTQTNSMGHRPRSINDTWYHRVLVRTAIKLLRHVRPRRGQVLFLTETLCVKYGTLVHLPEASTMEFIAHNTPIPVPKVYCAFTHKGCSYIVMERLKGECLAFYWKLRSEESQAKILQQLKGMVDSMRNVPPPSSAVANVDGGQIWDCRLPGSSYNFGPFDTIDAFHLYLRNGVSYSAFYPEVNELAQLHGREWPPPVLTHGDLSSLNIMAEGDTITGIVDWETAGWYPHYWEYTTACQVNFRNTFWSAEIDKFLQSWPEELRMEKLRQLLFGGYG